jgi:simple sugar transport system permease protein
MTAGRARRLGARLATRPEVGIVAITAAAAVYFAVATERFATYDNLVTLLPFFAPFAILAAGEVLLMVCGQIDLSIGSVALLSPFVVHALAEAGLPLLACVAGALLACALIGLLNGVMTEVVGISSFITTLGTLLGIGGLTLVVSNATPVAMPGTDPIATELSTFAKVFGGGTWSELVWALAIVAAVQVTLSATRWGRHAVAVGGNRAAAEQLGVNARRTVIRCFVLCSVLAGLAGILEAVRAGTATPDSAGASETMFRALSAAVIGGTLLVGGTGSAIGALIGALFLGILRDGLTLEGIDAEYLDVMLGVAILGAMALSIRIERLRVGRAGG